MKSNFGHSISLVLAACTVLGPSPKELLAKHTISPLLQQIQNKRLADYDREENRLRAELGNLKSPSKERAECLSKLASVFKEKGDFKNAARALKSVVKVQSKLFGKRSHQKVAAMVEFCKATACKDIPEKTFLKVANRTQLMISAFPGDFVDERCDILLALASKHAQKKEFKESVLYCQKSYDEARRYGRGCLRVGALTQMVTSFRGPLKDNESVNHWGAILVAELELAEPIADDSIRLSLARSLWRMSKGEERKTISGPQSDLFRAVAFSGVDEVRAAMNKGASANSLNNMGQTPLIIAIERNDVKIVQLLLESGAKPNRKDSSGVTPLMAAIRYANQRRREGAVASKPVKGTLHKPPTVTFSGSGAPNKEVIALILGAGAKVNERGACGNTALHWAAAGGLGEIVSVFKDKGADFNEKNDLSRNALHYAVMSSDLVTARLVMKEVTKVDAADVLGATALHMAAFKGNPTIVKELLERGADQYRKNESKLNALEIALLANSQEAARVLAAARGADVSSLDECKVSEHVKEHLKVRKSAKPIAELPKVTDFTFMKRRLEKRNQENQAKWEAHKKEMAAMWQELDNPNYDKHMRINAKEMKKKLLVYVGKSARFKSGVEFSIAKKSPAVKSLLTMWLSHSTYLLHAAQNEPEVFDNIATKVNKSVTRSALQAEFKMILNKYIPVARRMNADFIKGVAPGGEPFKKVFRELFPNKEILNGLQGKRRHPGF